MKWQKRAKTASGFGKAKKFRNVLRKAGIPRAAAIAVADEVRDIEAARAEGISFGAVAWGFTHMHALLEHAPEETFATVSDVAACIVGRPVR